MSLTARGFMGAGSVQFSLIVAGVAQGFGSKRITSKFEIKPATDKKELISKGKDDYGQVLETVYIPKPDEVTISLREADVEGLVQAFKGTVGVGAAQAAATVTDHAVLLKTGLYTQLPHKNLTAAVTLKDSTGATTYANGTDYEVIYLTGQIRPLPGTTITDLVGCKISYAAQAYTSQKILGSTRPSIRALVLFDGKNLADETPTLVTLWECVFTPESAFDFLANDFGDITLKGTLKTPLGKASPYEVEFLQLA